MIWNARALAEKPDCIPIGRPRGAKALGVRYERQLAKHLGPKALHGPWFECQTPSGHRYCQPDFVVDLGGEAGLLVLEAKLTWVAEGHVKLRDLYVPVVEQAIGRPAIGLVVCKNVVPDTVLSAHVCGTLGQALAVAREGMWAVWQWRG